MLPEFTHTISLPMSPWRRRKASYYLRSASLPCGSHPLIVNLVEQIRAVQSWAAGSDASLSGIKAGVSHIELLVSAMNDVINLSETRAVLQHATSTEYFLESLLYLVDSYGLLLSDIAMLRQHQFEVQSALRRHDSALVTSSLRSQRQIMKKLSRLATSLRAASKYSPLGVASDASEAEIALKEAIGATLEASVILFNRVVTASAAATSVAAWSALYTVRPLKKRICNMEKELVLYVKFEELDECVRIVESGSGRLLRSLVNSRVALLNIQSNLL